MSRLSIPSGQSHRSVTSRPPNRHSVSNFRHTALSYALGVYEALDTPISLSCYLLAVNGEYEQLVKKGINAENYTTPLAFFQDFQSVKLLSKFPNLDTGIDKRKVAQEKFVWAEDLCFETNARFRNSAYDSKLQGRVATIISMAQRKISCILGNVPRLETLDYTFGPGAAFGTRGDTSVFAKTLNALECTYALVDRLQEFLEEFPGWIPAGVHDVKLVPGSQLTFVPKDAKTDRPICIEPLLNGLWQHGIGSYIRKRLKRHGIDLNDQSTNQHLAGKAYEEQLATIDFTSASDTVSYGLVLELLPIEWFEFLDVARSPSYLSDDGRWRTFQKFSSMGNAYTFELETLIFYALAYACAEYQGIEVQTGFNLSVYGDDVIIPRDCYDLFAEVSGVCGFVIGHEKSFRSGNFFESCGQDFFQGTLVRPFQLKKELNSLLSTFYAANTLVRLSARLPKGVFRNKIRSRFSDFHSRFCSGVPRHLRDFGPEGYGDGHLIASFDACKPKRHRCYDAWWFYTHSDRASKQVIAETHQGYALYFARSRERQIPPSPALRKIEAPTDNGASYTMRGKTRVVRQRILCHGIWSEYVVDDGWFHSLNV